MHHSASAMGADAFAPSLGKVVLVLFGAIGLLLFMILPELQAIAPILLA